MRRAHRPRRRPITRSEPRTDTTTTSCPARVTSCRSSSRRNAHAWSRSSLRSVACDIHKLSRRAAWHLPVHTVRNQTLAPCPGRAKRDPGPRSDTTHVSTVHRFCRLALGPGSSLADARSAGTQKCRCRVRYARWLARRAMRREFISRCQTAQSCSFPRCVVTPGLVSLHSHPTRRGVGGAPTGALVLLSRLRDATDPRE